MVLNSCSRHEKNLENHRNNYFFARVRLKGRDNNTIRQICTYFLEVVDHKKSKADIYKTYIVFCDSVSKFGIHKEKVGFI